MSQAVLTPCHIFRWSDSGIPFLAAVWSVDDSWGWLTMIVGYHRQAFFGMGHISDHVWHDMARVTNTFAFRRFVGVGT